ncbi:MAG: hypothetical protein AAF985_23545, partial [Bacteroidota bacterium]
MNTGENVATIDALNLPCPSCGGQLLYSARHKKISCGHCGYLEEIDDSKDKVVERSLAAALETSEEFVPEELGKNVFECGNCGARFMVELEQVKVSCAFCASKNVNVEAFERQLIRPIGIIPFYISREEALRLFREWIGQGLFHPNKLKKLSEVDDLHGLYIPFWTYDAQVSADWSGEAGYYYDEVKTVRVNGQTQQQTVRKIRWTRRSGHLDHFFDDTLVVASDGLEQRFLEKILPFRLEEVVNFDPRLLMGWEAEVSNIDVNQGYQIAEQIMDHKLRNMCSAQLGGDTQRSLRVTSQKYEQTFKHIILPVWLCSYSYNNKIYHFT